MKGRKTHVVPLSERALELLTTYHARTARLRGRARRQADQRQSARQGAVQDGRTGVTPHGFRSTFRDWAAEQTHYQNHVVEMALAHTIGDKVEAAYRRGDLLAKRRELMQDWAIYCTA